MKPAPDDLGFATTADLPLFGWRERRTATVEQAVLPVDGTIQAAYEAWRGTDTGAAVYAWLRDRALLLAETGASRIGMKALWEQARGKFAGGLDNDFTPLVSRDLAADEPVLRGLFKFRERRAT